MILLKPITTTCHLKIIVRMSCGHWKAFVMSTNKAMFYKEAYSVLKPGGKLVIAEYLRTRRPLQTEDEALLREISDAWAIPDLDTFGEHQQHALQTGFQYLHNRDVTQHVMISYRNLRNTCQRYLWLSKLLHNLKIISTVRHKNLTGSMKQFEAIEKGVFTYHHLVAQK